MRVTAEIIGSEPAEPPGYHGNNAVSFWCMGTSGPIWNLHVEPNFGDVHVEAQVSDRSPRAGGDDDLHGECHQSPLVTLCHHYQ